jgi:hypothetical protein
MTASSGVVLANLAYLIGAVVLAVLGGTVVWLRHRQPKSVDANVASFNRGLRALAPDSMPVEEPSRAVGENPVRIQPRPGGLRVIRTDTGGSGSAEIGFGDARLGEAGRDESGSADG